MTFGLGAAGLGALIGGGGALIGGLSSAFGGGSGGGGYSSNMPDAQYYQPTGQGAADNQLQGYFNNYQNPYGAVSGYNTNYLNASQNNPYAAGAQTWANTAGQSAGNAGNSAYGAGSQLNASGMSGVGALQGLLSVNGETNPYSWSMVSGAGTAGNSLTGVGNQALTDASGLGSLASSYANPLTNYASSGLSGLQGLAQQTTAGLMPYAQATASQLPGMAAGYAAPGNAAASSILNTAFDPQSQLYSQSFQQNQDQVRASLAARGLNSSGTGAGIENQANQNFNTNWQNNQLGRQTQGLNAYNATSGQNYGMQSSALGQGLNSLLSASSGTFSPYSTAYGQGISGLNTAANTGYGLQSGAATTAQQLGAAGANNIAQGAAMPYGAYNTGLTDYTNNLGNIGSAIGTYGNVSGQGTALQGQGVNYQTQAGAVPYQTSQGILANNYGGLSNYLGLAGQGQNYNQQQIGDLAQYLGLGQSAGQGLTGAQGQQFNQNAQTYQGIGQGLGSLASAFGGSYSPYSNYNYNTQGNGGNANSDAIFNPQFTF